MVDFTQKRTKRQLSKLARQRWNGWRLVFSERGFDYYTVFHLMTEDEINEANAALDIQIEMEKKQLNKKKR